MIFCVTDGNTGGGQSLWGDKKKCWWVAAHRDPQLFGKLLQIYESQKWAGKDPTEQVGHLTLSFSSHSGSRCHTTLLSSADYSLLLLGIFNIPPFWPYRSFLNNPNPSSPQGAKLIWLVPDLKRLCLCVVTFSFQKYKKVFPITEL